MTYPTAHDVKTAAEAYRRIEMELQVEMGLSELDKDAASHVGWRNDGDGWHVRLPDGAEVWPYDGPELVVLSCGYAEVWSDGEVTGGPESFFVDSDGRAEGPQS